MTETAPKLHPPVATSAVRVVDVGHVDAGWTRTALPLGGIALLVVGAGLAFLLRRRAAPPTDHGSSEPLSIFGS